MAKQVVTLDPVLVTPAGVPIIAKENVASEKNKKINTGSEPTNKAPVNPQVTDNQYIEIDTVSDHTLGFIKKGDALQVKKLLHKRLGFEPPRMGGMWLMIELHCRKQGQYTDPVTGKKSLILMPDTEYQNDKFRKAVGLVIAKGPRAYREGIFEDSLMVRAMRKVFGKFMQPSARRPICDVGDWVVFPRHEGSMLGYRGVPCMIIPDDRIFFPVADPSYITLY